MITFIIRRLFLVPVVFFGTTLAIILLLQALSPTQRAVAFVKSEAQLRNLDLIIEQYGLDKPAYIQYGNWLKQVFQGNFGFSKSVGEPVMTAFKRRLPNTIELAVLAFIPIMAVGIWLGSVAALNRDRLLDQFLRTFTIILWSLPAFVLAIWLLTIFYGGLSWFPGQFQLSNANSLEIIKPEFQRYTGFLILDSVFNGRFDILLDVFHHLVLPVVTLVAISSAQIVRIMRSSLLDTLTQDFVRTARAKGLDSSVVNRKHALRNALIPIVTLASFTLVGLFNGVIITETVFGYPGIGNWLARAALEFDVPTVLAGAVFAAVTVVLANLLADILYAFVDPRIRYN
jgi:peptide/nickel transport system permease protein